MTQPNPLPDPVRITYRNPEFSVKEHVLVSRKDLWHKFILFNAASYDKSQILDKLISVCEPNFLVPYQYTREETGNVTFLTKCCAKTIQNLVMQRLSFQIEPQVIIHYDIVLGFLSTRDLPINPQLRLSTVVHSRYDLINKTLNLDNFENDEHLQPFYYPLSVGKVLEKILQNARTKGSREAKISIKSLSLARNRIRAINLLEKFFGPTLISLDLRHNCLEDIGDLKYFMDSRVTKVWLDGNPYCAKFATAQDYIEAVKTIFPALQVLDGVTVKMDRNLTNIQMYYLGDGSRTSLVKQFVAHYYTLYDQPDRIVMQGLYDDRAVYSMTVGMLNFVPSQMMKRFVTNRNLMKFVDYSKCHEYLFRGPDRIVAILRQQPATIHSVRDMNIDVVNCGNYHFVICLQGYFVYKALANHPLCFSRTLVVTAKEDCEYRIVNDLYHLSSAPSEMQQLKFEMKAVNFVPNALSSSEKEQLVTFLNKVSTMNRDFCKRWLEKAHWDIRLAVNNFMKAYTLNDIPKEAFQNSIQF